jgi:hypothetical protein
MRHFTHGFTRERNQAVSLSCEPVFFRGKLASQGHFESAGDENMKKEKEHVNKQTRKEVRLVENVDILYLPFKGSHAFSTAPMQPFVYGETSDDVVFVTTMWNPYACA